MMKKVLFILFAIFFTGNISAQFRKKNYKHIMKSKSIYEIDAFLRDAHKEDPRRAALKPRLIELMKKYIENAHPADPRIKEMQKKIALLKKNPSTKISFEEMTAEIKRKKIAEYKAKLQAKQHHQFKNKNSEPETASADNTETSEDVKPTSNTYANNHGQARQRYAYNGGGGSSSSSSDEEFNRLMGSSSENHEEKTVNLLNKLFENDPSSKETIVLIENKSKCNIVVTMEGAAGAKYKLPIPSDSENSMVIKKGDYLFTSSVCGAKYASQKTVQKSVMVTLNNK